VISTSCYIRLVYFSLVSGAESVKSGMSNGKLTGKKWS
jgi:hypothetical protein